jgi:hypothetical protein
MVLFSYTCNARAFWSISCIIILCSLNNDKETAMFKYLLAWVLGVPLGILVLIYVVSHVF